MADREGAYLLPGLSAGQRAGGDRRYEPVEGTGPWRLDHLGERGQCRPGHLPGGAGEAGGDGDLVEGLRQQGRDQLEATADSKPGDEQEKYSSFGFGAVFAEVCVDPELGTVRVPRIIGAYDVGRVINPKIARSQCIGGMMDGLGLRQPAVLKTGEFSVDTFGEDTIGAHNGSAEPAYRPSPLLTSGRCARCATASRSA